MNCTYIMLIFSLSCRSLGSAPGLTENITESIQKKVFICEYESANNIFTVGEKSISVDCAWLEKRWIYKANMNEIIIASGYQLIIHTMDKLDENYSFDWTIGIDFSRNYRSCGYNCLVTDFESLPKAVENWTIQKGRDLHADKPHKIIGELTLRKKN